MLLDKLLDNEVMLLVINNFFDLLIVSVEELAPIISAILADNRFIDYGRILSQLIANNKSHATS